MNSRPELELMLQGTELMLRATADRPHLAGPSRLPSWSRRHVVAHLAANAQALSRLATWARTGVEQAMYASKEQRQQEIEEGAHLRDSALHDWVRTSAAQLQADLGALDADTWVAEVVTAQGRRVPASVLPWLRSREVFIHTVDLNIGIEFTDLPDQFCGLLVDDVVAQRTARGEQPSVRLHSSDDRSWLLGPEPHLHDIRGTSQELAGWLTGRTAAPGRTDPSTPAPTLSSWL